MRSAVSTPGASVAKIGSRCVHDVVLAADHQAVAPLEAEDATARADVDVVDAGGLQALGAVDVVAVVRVAAVDDDVARREHLREIGDRRVDEGGGHHDPHRSRLGELRHEVFEAVATDRAFAGQPLHRIRAHVVDDALVSGLHQPPHHVGAHAAETDHA